MLVTEIALLYIRCLMIVFSGISAITLMLLDYVASGLA